MKKVFYLCVEAVGASSFTAGKEYPCNGCRVLDDAGSGWTSGLLEHNKLMSSKFMRIERETFQAHNLEWYRHAPGEPMPCDGGAFVFTLLEGERPGFGGEKYLADYAAWDLKGYHNSDIIGWRYAEQAGERAQSNVVTYVGRAVGDGVADNASAAERKVSIQIVDRAFMSPGFLESAIKALCSEEVVVYQYQAHDNDDMKQADIAAVTDHGHLSSGQRKYIDAMEAKQAAKESGAAEREQANQIERGKALESAAQAMDSVRDVHGHRLGWMA